MKPLKQNENHFLSFLKSFKCETLDCKFSTCTECSEFSVRGLLIVVDVDGLLTKFDSLKSPSRGVFHKHQIQINI